MDIKALTNLHEMLNERVQNMEDPLTEDRLLTKSVIEFIMYLIEEETKRQKPGLVASQQDIDDLLGSTL